MTRPVAHMTDPGDGFLAACALAEGDSGAQEAADRARVARHREAVATVQRFLPDYASLPGASGPFLVFSPEHLMTLLGAVAERGLVER